MHIPQIGQFIGGVDRLPSERTTDFLRINIKKGNYWASSTHQVL